MNCNKCKQKCVYDYYYAQGVYYCEKCIHSVFPEDEWADLHEEYPDEYYYSTCEDV